MALQKTPIPINFSKGLDGKTDPFQVQIGNFLQLENSVFNTLGRLTKRPGYRKVTTLPVTTQTTLTTLNDSLVATGTDLYAYSEDINRWVNQGKIQPIDLATSPMLRVSSSQESPDVAIAPSGIACLAYVDGGNAYYQITDSSTGQQVVSRTALPTGAADPRVFLLAPYFIITFTVDVIGTPHLQYIAIPLANPTAITTASDISSDVKEVGAGYDGFSSEGRLFLAWNAGGTAVNIAYLSNSLAVVPDVEVDTVDADRISVTVDESNATIWVSYYDSGSQDGFAASFNFILAPIVDPTQIITGIDVAEITSVSQNGVLQVYYQNINNYSYQHDSADIRSDYITSLTVTPPVGTGTGTVSTPSVILRSVGLASKAFIASDDQVYMMVVYGDNENENSVDNTNQSTYFLIDRLGNIYMRLAYSNGDGYAKSQVLPSVNTNGSGYSVPYLIADFLTTVNKNTNLPSGTPSNAIYTQYGINLATFVINDNSQHTSEIAGALHLTGGQLWEYDGVKPVEHGFHVWPENVVVTTSGSSGSIANGTYFYVFTYEWTDAAGNLHRSAPSIPVSIVTSGGGTSTNTLYVPTLRLTYKTTPNPVRIVGYRWSVAQQVYYQFTSITSPTLNNPAADSVTFTDTLPDEDILGNTLLYTTGGVLENIAAPASIDSTLFDNRLWLISAENRNLLQYSKQVIQNVPVEMSDLLTKYVAPTIGTQGSTGDMTAIAAMDDKLIIFKENAIYYINGNGPDNAGANNTYSEPVFITSSVGCTNPDSIVLTKDGLMFQSNKGIWLLGRGLDTSYIGFPVEQYNDNVVLSAETVPGTNYVLFVLDNQKTLMYDYFVQQWGTHSNIQALSATLYQGMHTYLNSSGQILQNDLNIFTDNSTPVLMSITTSWINLAGLQGLERFYFANLLGTYISPFKLNVQLAYNYNSSPKQNIIVTPDNQTGNWGEEAVWGSGGPWGGPGNVFSARIFPQEQKCQSFQIIINELYDPSFSQPPGEGLSLSGLLLTAGVKRGFRTQSARRSYG